VKGYDEVPIESVGRTLRPSPLKQKEKGDQIKKKIFPGEDVGGGHTGEKKKETSHSLGPKYTYSVVLEGD